jgi:hypothetical protein
MIRHGGVFLSLPSSFRQYRRCLSRFPHEGNGMVVTNSSRTTAIVIRNDGHKLVLVPMKGGKISAKAVAFDEFRRDWTETGYALSQALTTFLAHVMKWGARWK